MAQTILILGQTPRPLAPQNGFYAGTLLVHAQPNTGPLSSPLLSSLGHTERVRKAMTGATLRLRRPDGGRAMTTRARRTLSDGPTPPSTRRQSLPSHANNGGQGTR